MVNVDDDDVNDDVDDEIIPLVPEFGDVSGFSFVVSNDYILIHIRLPERSNLEVRQIFSSKNELINAVK